MTIKHLKSIKATEQISEQNLPFLVRYSSKAKISQLAYQFSFMTEVDQNPVFKKVLKPNLAYYVRKSAEYRH